MPLSAKGKKSSQREPLVGERSRRTIRPERGTLCRCPLRSIVVGGGGDPWTSHYKRSRPGKGVAEQISPIPGNPGVTHLIFTAMQRRSAARDSSPNAPACRSRRGDAPEGSPVFSPDVEGRSPEDSGKEELGQDIRPRQGVALIRESGNRCDTLAGSRDLLRCPVHGSSGLRPSTSWL